MQTPPLPEKQQACLSALRVLADDPGTTTAEKLLCLTAMHGLQVSMMARRLDELDTAPVISLVEQSRGR